MRSDALSDLAKDWLPTVFIRALHRAGTGSAEGGPATGNNRPVGHTEQGTGKGVAARPGEGGGGGGLPGQQEDSWEG